MLVVSGSQAWLPPFILYKLKIASEYPLIFGYKGRKH